MQVIKAHQTLYRKLAILGVAALFISGYLAFYIDDSIRQSLNESVQAEAAAYCESVKSAADLSAEDLVKNAAALYAKHLEIGGNASEALVYINQELDKRGLEKTLLWYIDPREKTYSYLTRSDDGEIIDRFRQLRADGRAYGTVLHNSVRYILAYSRLAAINGDEASAWLIAAFPHDDLIHWADRSGRVSGIKMDGIGGSSKTAPSEKTLVSNVLYTYDKQPAGVIYIAVDNSLRLLKDGWLWKLYLLAFLPILNFILLVYLITRYFGSYISHSQALRKLAKREKSGAEIFRRDHYVVKNYMPELAELFEIVNESLADKNRYKRSLEIQSASMMILGEKGFVSEALDAVVEIVTKTMNCAGGAIFSSKKLDRQTEVYGKYNFDDDIARALGQTPLGSGFLKLSEKKSAGIHLTDIKSQSADEPWQKIFAGYQHVLTMPLRFRGQTIGVLILLNQQPNIDDLLPEGFAESAADLLSAIIYGATMEKDKASRSEKAKILQETSLAISSTLNLTSVLSMVASRLADYAGVTYCLILLNTEQDNILEVGSFYSKRRGANGMPDSARINLADFPKLLETIKTNQALTLGPQELRDFSATENQFLCTDMVRQITALPISHSGKAIGLVLLGEERSQERSAMPPDKLSFVQAMVAQAASAIENARLYGFINRKVEQLSTLYNVSAVIHSETDTHTMLEKVLTATGEFLPYSAAAIWGIDEKIDSFVPMAVNGLINPELLARGALSATGSLLSQVAQSGKSHMISDIRIETGPQSSFAEAVSELAVPIRISEKVIGIFSIGSIKKCAFGNLDEDFLETLAAQIAVAMERSRLFEQERERGLKLRTIFEFSRKLSRSINLQEVLKIAVESIREAFEYQLVAIFAIDNNGGNFYVGYQSAASARRLPDDFTVPRNKGLLGQTINTRKTIYCADVTREPQYVTAIEDVKSEVCIPIIVGDKIMGVLDVESMNYDDFTAEDIGTLEAFSDIMAVAMDNSYLFEEIVQKAERLSLIDNINKAISATLDLDSFFKVVAKAVADNAGYRWTSLVVPENESFSFKAGYAPRSAGAISPGPILDMLQDNLRTVIEQARPEFVSFSQLARLGDPQKLQVTFDAGIRNLGLFPIGDSAKADAVMIVGSSRSEGFSSQELLLLKDLAVHLRIAWQNAQLYRQLKTAFDQLQEAQERVIQTEKLRALGEMSSGVVHDFNNILAAILGRTQILQRRLCAPVDADGTALLEKGLGIIEKAALDGSHILSRISEFTKKKPSEKFVAVHLDQIIADAIELTRPKWCDVARSDGKKIEVEFNRSGLLQAAGSPSELREVFTNLIINAVDAIPNTGRITIEAAADQTQRIKIVLQDDGQGMAEETRKRIFEPFFTTKGSKGTGLGLSVTYGIISRHKGNIEVESKAGVGTKFIITLPALVSMEGTPSAPVTCETRARAREILVVDDQEEFSEILLEILMSKGYHADSVGNGHLAMEALRRKKYDLVITDLGMPGFSGWELADAIFRDWPETRVVMATGWGTQLDPKKLTVHHVSSIICKPFKIDEILSVVENALLKMKDEEIIVKV